MGGFFHPCHLCSAQFGSRNLVSNWELRVEGISSNFLSLRELLYSDMFSKGRISSSLCYRHRFLGAVWIVSHGIGQLCSWSGSLEPRRRTFGIGSYFPD